MFFLVKKAQLFEYMNMNEKEIKSLCEATFNDSNLGLKND